ncbi:hypothetical protein [Shewanella sp. UCD-KL12]|uniref:hypothetical protein n=1 Tax=Shewanella sp. UCD-KL12 TaxID=1917163 RepID=UPI0009713FB7|nr:hypothetical protein [Shewanella sp. UCD-KL12]
MSHSTQMFQSKLTLVLLLVVFVSQLFPTCIASEIHLNEQSTHLSSLNSEQTESCCHSQGHQCKHARSISDQEHDSDFHTSCHPPIELSFFLDFNQVDGASQFMVSYQNRNYAPPIPPPHA